MESGTISLPTLIKCQSRKSKILKISITLYKICFFWDWRSLFCLLVFLFFSVQKMIITINIFNFRHIFFNMIFFNRQLVDQYTDYYATLHKRSKKKCFFDVNIWFFSCCFFTYIFCNIFIYIISLYIIDFCFDSKFLSFVIVHFFIYFWKLSYFAKWEEGLANTVQIVVLGT